MENRNTLYKIDCPQAWRIKNDYDSHRPLLYLALKNTYGMVFEAGMGFGSTLLISEYCGKKRRFESFETNKEWFEKIKKEYSESEGSTGLHYCKDYFKAIDNEILHRGNPGLLFIDCAPGEIRKDLIKKYQDIADIIMVHDTEEGAQNIYGIRDALNSFKFRLDYYPKSEPGTTALSNTINVTQWINHD